MLSRFLHSKYFYFIVLNLALKWGRYLGTSWNCIKCQRFTFVRSARRFIYAWFLHILVFNYVCFLTRNPLNMAPSFYVLHLPSLFSPPSCSFLAPFFCILHLPALFCHACSCHLPNGSIISKSILSLICGTWRRRTFFPPTMLDHCSHISLFSFSPQRNWCGLCRKGQSIHISHSV